MESKIVEIPSSQKDVILFERELDAPVMRNVVNRLMEKHEGICAVFVGTDKEGYNFIIGSKMVDCREIATKLRESLDARGGGKVQMIQGSVVAETEEIKRVLL